jgi:8-oxo-dGTP diphosphatase
LAEKFIVGCYGLTFSGEGLLMVRQRSGHWAGRWILPGGKLEMGESLEECVERETHEETHCRVKAVKQLRAISSYSPDSAFERQVVLVFYLCKHLEGEPKKGDGVDAAEWVSVDRFERLSAMGLVPPLVFDIVSDLCACKSFPSVSFDFQGAAAKADAMYR